MKNIITRWEIKKFMFIKEIKFLEVRKAPIIEWYKLESYIVTINALEEQFQYSDWKLYLDETNVELNKQDIEKNKKVIKMMEEEWKTEAEIREFIEWKWVDYIDRVEFIIVCEWLIDMIDWAIKQIEK